MKAELEAKNLIKAFMPQTVTDWSDENFEQTKKVALICIEEIQLRFTGLKNNGMKHLNFFDKAIIDGELNHLESVKEELKNL